MVAAVSFTGTLRSRRYSRTPALFEANFLAGPDDAPVALATTSRGKLKGTDFLRPPFFPFCTARTNCECRLVLRPSPKPASGMLDLRNQSTAINRPRLLTKSQAAAYCSVSNSTFSNWVRKGKLPRALPGTARWDARAIDIALDAMSGLQPQQDSSALDEWRANRARRSEGNS